MANIIEDTVKILLDCELVGRARCNQVRPSIFIVPGAYRDLSPSSFNPRVVSIGPLHRKDENLQRFEVQKTTYLHNLLNRLELKPEKTLRRCAEKVIVSVERIKACYGGSMTCDDFELAKIMVIDGCFILEFIMCLYAPSSGANMFDAQSICYDLLLIENQIPFFVLNIIFECTIVANGRMGSNPLTKYIEVVLLHSYLVFNGKVTVPYSSPASTPDHILGFVHKFYQPAEAMPPVDSSDPKGHSATELARAGLNFKPSQHQNWAMTMKLELPSPFSWFRWRTLTMRTASIHDFTELIIRNLLIYEQFSNVNKYVASYVVAMDMLIDTSEDVALLVNSKVLVNNLGSDADAANMINNLCKEVTVATFYYDQQWKDMDDYYNSYWPNTLAGLQRTYFNNPWSIFTLFAAFVMFALIVVQTIFTIKAA